MIMDGAVATGTLAAVLVLVCIWKLCGHVRRTYDLRSELHTDRAAAFRVLSDPKNLRKFHPYTIEVRIVNEKEEGGIRTVDFVLVEKIFLFNVITENTCHMTCDPMTYSIAMNFTRGDFIVNIHWTLEDGAQVPIGVSNGNGRDFPDGRESHGGTTIFKNKITLLGKRLLVLWIGPLVKEAHFVLMEKAKDFLERS